MTPNQKYWKDFLFGNKAAMSAIFLNYYDDLFRYGLRLVHDENIVKDAIQELFLKLWKNRLNLKPIENLKPYLFKSLRHHIIDSLELIKPTLHMEDGIEYRCEVVYSTEDFIISSQVTEEIRERVIHALNQLKPRQREAIYLRYFEENSFETIALIMDMNIQSVRNTLHRGMKALRDLMLLQSFFLLLGNSGIINS